MRSIRVYPTNVVTTAVVTTGLFLGGVGGMAPAHAGGGDFVTQSGGCSAASLWDMKAKVDQATGRLEMEFGVDSNIARQTWSVRITDNRTLVFSGNRVTRAPSGSLSADRLTADRAGTDHFRAVARNLKSGEVCRGSVRLVPNGGGSNSG